MRSTIAHRSRQTTLGLVTAFVALMSGCSDSATFAPPLAPYRAEPTASKYAAGDTVYYVLRNVSDGQLSYSYCGATLQRLTAAGWTSIIIDDLPLCPSVATLLNAGSDVRLLGGVLPTSATAGQYRYQLDDIGTGWPTTSTTFDRPTTAVFLMAGPTRTQSAEVR